MIGPPNAEYQTTLARGASAIIVGAIVGGTMVVLPYTINQLKAHGFAYVERYGLPTGATVFGYAFLVWLTGLTLLGAPPWLVLHRSYRRHWFHALVLGATLTVTIPLGFSIYELGYADHGNVIAGDSGGPTGSDGRMTLHGWAGLIWDALLLGADGAAVAFIVWRTAYRRRKVDPEVPRS